MVNKKRLIDVDEVKKDFNIYFGGWDHAIAANEILDDQPIVDAVEVVHGRWLMDKLEIGNPYDGNSTMIADIGNCSVCGYRCEMLPVMNYCPNCGAKMDGDGND